MKKLSTGRLISVGVSACLLGYKVRYDGLNRSSRRALARLLGNQFDLCPLCPEVAIGLSVPRPPIQLVGNDHQIRAVGVTEPDKDYTESLRAYANSILPLLDDLSGLMLKSRSPSCGIESSKIIDPHNPRTSTGSGIVAATIADRLPQLPLIDEIALETRCEREQFIARVVARSQQ